MPISRYSDYSPSNRIVVTFCYPASRIDFGEQRIHRIRRGNLCCTRPTTRTKQLYHLFGILSRGLFGKSSRGEVLLLHVLLRNAWKRIQLETLPFGAGSSFSAAVFPCSGSAGP